jgi:hypothetical protein
LRCSTLSYYEHEILQASPLQLHRHQWRFL